MLRSFFNIFLILTLVISSAGITFSKHFCNQELVSYQLKSDVEPCCEDENCCHNEIVTIDKISDYTVPGLETSFTIISKNVLASPLVKVSKYSVILKNNPHYSLLGFLPRKHLNIYSFLQVFIL